MISIYTLLSIADVNVSRTTNIKEASAVVNSLSVVQAIYGGHVYAKAWTLRRQDTESEGISNLKNRVIREIRAKDFVLFVCLTWSKQA